MKRIKRFGVYQTSKVAAVIFFFVGLIIVIPLGFIIQHTMGGNSLNMPFGGGIMFFLLPVLYGVMGFIMTAISCSIYNLIAKWIGGIEIEFEIDPNNEPVNKTE